MRDDGRLYKTYPDTMERQCQVDVLDAVAAMQGHGGTVIATVSCGSERPATRALGASMIAAALEAQELPEILGDALDPRQQRAVLGKT